MIALTLACMVIAAPNPPAQWTRRISESSSGIQGDGDTYDAKFSDDGRSVVMKTMAANLGGSGNIVWRDLATHRTRGVANNYLDPRAVPNGDGRYVLHSWSTDKGVQVTDCLTGTIDIILRDFGNLIQPTDISADGRYVVFHTDRANLVAGDVNGASDVFVFDRVTRLYSIVSRDSQGVLGTADSSEARMSPDGRFVAFTSEADNLAPGDVNGEADAFLHDRLTGATVLVTQDLQGAPAGGGIRAVSADGMAVVFASDSDALVPGDTNNVADVFVYSRANGAIERISTDSSGLEANAPSYGAAVSASGRFVAFVSVASNLAPGEVNLLGDVFVKDRTTGATELVSLDQNGLGLRHGANLCDISADGSMVAFFSYSQIAPGETNSDLDVYVRHRGRHAGDRADAITLAVALKLTAGAPATFSWYGAEEGSRCWLLASLSDAGTLLHGHRFGVGPGAVIAGATTCNERGNAELTTPPLPQMLAGRTVFFEVAARDESGAFRDSNLVERIVR